MAPNSLKTRPSKTKFKVQHPILPDEADGAEFHKSPFGEGLDQHYRVIPIRTWNRFEKVDYILVDEHTTYRVNHPVFVMHEGTKLNENDTNENDTNENDTSENDINPTDPRAFWVATIIELRVAKSITNTGRQAVAAGASRKRDFFAVVAWMYWPNGLPCGKGKYHGSLELVPSNDLDIVNGNSLAGEASVVHWLEREDYLPDPRIPYWRQTYCGTLLELSELQTHCTCRRYFNPDETMHLCNNCKIWLFEECLQNEIRTEVYNELIGGMNADIASQEMFEVRILEGEKALQAQITQKESGQVWTKPIFCLACGTRFPESDHPPDQTAVPGILSAPPRSPATATTTSRRQPPQRSVDLNTASRDLGIVSKIRKERYEHHLNQYNRVKKVRFHRNGGSELNVARYIAIARLRQSLLEDSNDYGRALSEEQVLAKLREAKWQRN